MACSICGAFGIQIFYNKQLTGKLEPSNMLSIEQKSLEVFTRACLKNKYCTKHMFLLPFHAKIKEKGVILC